MLSDADYSFKMDEVFGSSMTEDEIEDGFKMVLPVVSHRRKSIEKTRRKRRDSLTSENGTSSVSLLFSLYWLDLEILGEICEEVKIDLAVSYRITPSHSQFL